MKLLIVQTSFIGDVVLATALAEKLHHRYPDARIDFLVRRGNESLFTGHPFITKIWAWDRKKDKYPNLFKLAKSIRMEQYDLLINLQRFFSSGLLTALSGAKQKRGFSKNPFAAFYDKKVEHVISTEGKLHEVERNQLLIADMTDGMTAKPRLYPTPADFESIAMYMQEPYICIAPCSAWFTKQYPEEKWVDFIRKISADISIYLIGAPGDHITCERIIKAGNHTRTFNLSGKLGYLQSAALMKGALMNYVNDSAPQHFASAMDAPVTAIFCSTVPAFGYGPLSADSIIIQTKEYLPCKPCGLHGHRQCPLKHFKCALTIETDTLLATLP